MSSDSNTHHIELLGPSQSPSVAIWVQARRGSNVVRYRHLHFFDLVEARYRHLHSFDHVEARLARHRHAKQPDVLEVAIREVASLDCHLYWKLVFGINGYDDVHVASFHVPVVLPVFPASASADAYSDAAITYADAAPSTDASTVACTDISTDAGTRHRRRRQP